MRIGHATFGPWVVDLDGLVLDLTAGPDRASCRYEIDLERCTTPAEVLDWIFQVRGKAFASPEVLTGLIHALQATLDPQATLCSWGVAKDAPVTAADVRRRLIEYLGVHDAEEELRESEASERSPAFSFVAFNLREWHEATERHAKRWEAAIDAASTP
ncbi:MAG TPA: hypothetical protein VFA08_01350 [Actinomycetota bacterium]|nr:hypothetical protein [Actinomycetota bacterium]